MNHLQHRFIPHNSYSKQRSNFFVPTFQKAQHSSARGEICAPLSSEWGSGQAVEVISKSLQLKLRFSGPTPCSFAPPWLQRRLVGTHVCCVLQGLTGIIVSSHDTERKVGVFLEESWWKALLSRYFTLNIKHL